MSILRALVSALALPALLLATPALSAEPLPDGTTARILAGLETDAFAGDDKRRKVIDEHLADAQGKWLKYDKKIGKKLSAWAKAELGPQDGGTIYYPFGGPDFPTVQLLYPNADRYVLIALQKGGRMPSLATYNMRTFKWWLRVFKRGWVSFAQRGFFHTDHMKRDMGEDSVLEGITPILAAFAVRMGYDVASIAPVRINADGSALEVIDADRDKVETWDSVRLTLKRRSDGKQAILDYLHLDLSDGFLKKDDAARTWITNMSNNPVFTKAASHLMQKPFFSVVRDAILDHAPSVVQDETGVDYDDLLGRFNVRLYGDFTRANKLWTEGVQRSLANAYRTRKDIKALPFKVGYRKESGSCIQVAVRKPTPP